MKRLWLSIIYLCYWHGQIDGLNEISEITGQDFATTWRRLRILEQRDNNLKVYRYGRGRKMKIFYQFNEGIPLQSSIPFYHHMRKSAITFEPDMLYRKLHEPARSY